MIPSECLNIIFEYMNIPRVSQEKELIFLNNLISRYNAIKLGHFLWALGVIYRLENHHWENSTEQALLKNNFELHLDINSNIERYKKYREDFERCLMLYLNSSSYFKNETITYLIILKEKISNMKKLECYVRDLYKFLQLNIIHLQIARKLEYTIKQKQINHQLEIELKY